MVTVGAGNRGPRHQPLDGQEVGGDPRQGMRKGLTTYGDIDFSLFLRKAFIKGAGYSDDALDRPIVGIIDTGSGFNPCHANMPQLIDAVKRGVLLSGCLPIPFPTISLHESFAAPTSMYLRNLMSMDTEEMLKAQPLDAVVMIGGCDKTVPAQLMGAASADVVPAFQLVVGPMVTGSHRGERVGACTDCRGYWAKHRAGLVDIEEIAQVSNELVPSVGTCGVMGTASTMACLSEAMGVAPLGSATAPANSSERLRIAEQTGKLAARAAQAGSASTPRTFLTRKSFENAITVLQAVGGSTNAVVHLLAIAGRLSGIDLTLADFDRIGRKTPLLVDLKPSGLNYMQDLHAAGGVVRLLSYLRPLLHLDARTVTGSTLGEELDRFPLHDYPQAIVRPLSDPVFAAEALCVLTGNLAPQGCIIKQSAVLDRRLVRHRGRAVVFSSAADLAARIDAPDLDVDEDSVLVLQNIGPVGHPGMPEAGYMPIPAKLARRGIKDMVRISDGRMSGTANGAIVLHVSPEAAVGGPLALVRQGDFIELDVQARRLHLDIGKEEFDQRLADWKLSHGNGRLRVKGRGYRKLYKEHVLQAHKGADFDFLTADGGSDSTLG